MIRPALATVFGLGRLRPAPGTWGSLPPPALVLLLVLGGASAWVINAALAAVALFFSVACVALGPWAERQYGRKDPRQVVADETAGQAVALLFLPWRFGEGGFAWNLMLAGISFLAFRLFDIIKPPPARGLERLGGGWGILLDDLVAGALALGVTQVLVRVVLPLG